MNEISQELFAKFFGPDIRVRFDWSRFFAERWPIKLEIVTDKAKLNSLYPPWYLARGVGPQVPYCDNDAKPFAFDKIPEALARLEPSRRQQIKALSHEFSQYKKPIRLFASAYSLGGGRLLILDGNHRLAGVALGDFDFALLAFVVHGPMDSGALPDLAHWTP